MSLDAVRRQQPLRNRFRRIALNLHPTAAAAAADVVWICSMADMVWFCPWEASSIRRYFSFCQIANLTMCIQPFTPNISSNCWGDIQSESQPARCSRIDFSQITETCFF